MRSREVFLQDLRIKKIQLDAMAPQVGDMVPDFEAVKVSDDGRCFEKLIKFSELLDKPVGLLFGSYTCPCFRRQLLVYEEIYRRLRDHINFLCIYVREAHPVDGWHLPKTNKNIRIPTPKNLYERAIVARHCFIKGFTIPMVLDTMDDHLSNRFVGSPQRLYAINTDGVITHKSIVGPFKRSEIRAWYRALRGLLTWSGTVEDGLQ